MTKTKMAIWRFFSENREAYHDYSVIDMLETWIVLSGDEVKMVRNGHINLNSSYIAILKDEAWFVKSSMMVSMVGVWMNAVR